MGTVNVSGDSAKGRQINNQGTRRFVVGPAPKSQRSKGGQAPVVLGTPADQMMVGLPEDKRLDNAATVSKEVAELPAFKAAAAACSVRVA